MTAGHREDLVVFQALNDSVCSERAAEVARGSLVHLQEALPRFVPIMR